MMGLEKPQRFAIFEVTVFIYYGNVREFVFLIGINQNGETRYYLVKLILPLDSQTQWLLFDL